MVNLLVFIIFVFIIMFHLSDIDYMYCTTECMIGSIHVITKMHDFNKTKRATTLNLPIQIQDIYMYILT